MLVIGKSSHYYTLWEVEEKHHEGRFGGYTTITHTYYKNISLDRETAEKKYPGIPVDLGLSGHSSWESREYDKPQNTQFRFGKYKGVEIVECQDYSYMAWYWDQTDDEQKSLIESIICNGKGYRKITLKGYNYLITETEYQKREDSFEFVENLKTETEENGYLEVVMERNLDDCGYALINQNRICLVFKEFAEMEYNGYPYGLPVKNGKAKRVKGKTLRIFPSMLRVDTFLPGSSLYVEVKDFEIL